MHIFVNLEIEEIGDIGEIEDIRIIEICWILDNSHKTAK